MIQPKELKIGNFVKDRGNKQLRIDWFEKDKVCMKQVVEGHEVHPMTEYFEDLLPIEVNDQWLLDLGFIKDGFHNSTISIARFKEEHSTIELNRDYLFLRERKLGRNPDDVIVIWNRDLRKKFYVHEVQNFYFACTQKELPFKHI